MSRRLLGLLAAAAATAAVGPVRGTARDVPSPEAVLGFRMGEDRTLADWRQIDGYFRALDAASDRVRVDEVGKTTEGNPFLVVTITSPANFARLEEIRRTNLRLADPRGLSEQEARQLLARGKTIVALNHGIHSTEVAATQTALETAHLLASSQEPEILQVLDETVVLMIPSQNPDGTQRVTEWYRKTLDTPYEGGEIPFLYQRYTGHDNNRDWYMFTQQETRLTVAHVYDRWHPQIVHDLHQMAGFGARFFAPPYVDPWEPNVDPALRAATNALGLHVAARLTSAGKHGVVVHALYDAWTPARAYPFGHAGVRLLTESAATRMASPLRVTWDQLVPGIGYDAKRASWNFPDPWPGGTWRLSDVVEYQLSASRAILEHAAKHRDFWLRNFLEVSRRAAGRSVPYAFVLPAQQRDPFATWKLLDVMRRGGVEVQRAREAFEAGRRRFPAGSHAILMAQPASAFAKMLLEPQRYPDLRQYPGGPPQRPYDVTAHTLPLLLGVETVAVTDPFAAALEPVAEVSVAPGRIEGRGRFLALGHGTGDLVALGGLLAKDVPVRWALEAFTDAGRGYAPGTLLVPDAARDALAPLAARLGVTARGVAASPRALALARPRVGLYQSWVASMDEGWTRFVFEKDVGVAYDTIHDADVRAGNLHSRFDVLVFPSQAPDRILSGHAAGTLPQEYVGGIGKQGLESLRTFAQAGGTLVALNAASELFLADFGLPASNVLATSDPAEPPFYCPGAILQVAVDGASPLGHGLGGSSPVWFEEGPAFEVKGGTVVARYVDEDPLLSGWLLGGHRLLGKAALVELPLGRGRVVLFGFRPQYRAQSWSTYVALLNAIYTSAATPAVR